MSPSIVPTNRLKKLLREGRSAVGTMIVEIRQPSVMRMAANAGLDFVIVDNEHGAFDVETIADLSRAARDAGVTPIVRVPEWSYAHIAQPLDAGAQGIMAPRITEPRQVHEILQIMKYPPLGRRGSVVGRGHTDLKSGSIVDVMRDANEESLLVVQIETREALERVEEFLGIEGVDVALVGPTDLSVALGIAGELADPLLADAIESVIQACSRHGVFPAIHMNDLALASHWAAKGMRLVSYNSEVGVLTNAWADAASWIRSAKNQA